MSCDFAHSLVVYDKFFNLRNLKPKGKYSTKITIVVVKTKAYALTYHTSTNEIQMFCVTGLSHTSIYYLPKEFNLNEYNISCNLRRYYCAVRTYKFAANISTLVLINFKEIRYYDGCAKSSLNL